jgi:hypothetical protein
VQGIAEGIGQPKSERRNKTHSLNWGHGSSSSRIPSSKCEAMQGPEFKPHHHQKGGKKERS